MFNRSNFLGDCWLFEGATTKGYGQIRFSGKMCSCHRLSAIMFLGLNASDKTQHALHKIICSNKNCWRPEHLYVGTDAENKIDRIYKGEEHIGNQYTHATHCVNGHEFTPENTYQYGNGQRRCKQCYKDRYEASKER